MRILTRWPLPIIIGSGALLALTVFVTVYALTLLVDDDCELACDEAHHGLQHRDTGLTTADHTSSYPVGHSVGRGSGGQLIPSESLDNQSYTECLPEDCEALPTVPPRRDARLHDSARARVASDTGSEIFQRRRSWGRFSGGSEDDEAEDPEYSSIRQYLTDADEQPTDVPEVVDILSDPSNVVSAGDAVNLVAWDVRDQEPRGSYLYVLQQDLENNISQVHRYFCPQRRLDILAEICEPIASVFSEAGEPRAVQYTEDGVPSLREASDLDPSQFSRGNAYVEANEFLLYLQDYFDSTRA